MDITYTIHHHVIYTIINYNISLYHHLLYHHLSLSSSTLSAINHHSIAMELELIFYRYGSFPSGCVGPVAIMNTPLAGNHGGSCGSDGTDVEVCCTY